MKVVIDTDPGTDDALALMMALHSPELDIQGLTTVGGNGALSHVTRNALDLMEYLGQPHMPVSRGAARPMRGRFHYAYYFHGSRGLTVRLPRAQATPRPLRAPEYLISLAYSFAGELVLITLGPLTNVARAMAREPRLKEWISHIIVMGGAVEVPGNVTPYAEFNIYNDPLAASAVFASGVPITLVGLDVCLQTYLTEQDLAWIAGPSRSEQLAQKLLAGWFQAHPGGAYHLCDPLAVAAAVQPGLLKYRQATVAVEVQEGEKLGKTTASYGNGNVRVALEVDAGAARVLMRELLRG